VLDPHNRPVGIITEYDVIQLLAAGRADALRRPVAAVMSAPVAALPPDAYLYAAIARMNRRKIRHLAVTDPVDGRLVGILYLSTVLRQRAEDALVLQNDIAEAASAAELRVANARLPRLAAALRREQLRPEQIANVIGTAYCDLTARAADLALEEMAATGKGPAPARWCLLILGSAGRGESLLSADQDNALIHDGEDDDHPWFAEFGQRIADLLDAAGLPYCRGGVMAAKRDLRHNVKGWRKCISAWLEAATAEALLNADIFYDFRPVAGEFRLAASLRAEAITSARGHRVFHALLAKEIGHKGSALGLLGKFRTRGGRVDLKGQGLQPLVMGARVLALELGLATTSSLNRWRAAAAAQLVSEDDLARIEDAFSLILGLILDQQLADLENGLPPSANVETGHLVSIDKERLKRALHIVDQIDLLVRNALGLI
jgi:signal-transduction protein with cAMP-binding, CBS, and nucleotidyltransferase domain